MNAEDFFLGVLASLCASAAFVLLSRCAGWIRARPTEEYWLEDIPEFGKHRFSIGRFYYNKWGCNYCYDGTNFTSAGDVHYQWSSKMLSVHLTTHRVTYFYQLDYRDQIQNSRDGFGVMCFGESGKGIVLSHGYFVDCEDITKPINHTLVPLSRVIAHVGFGRRAGEDMDTFHRRIVVEAYEKQLNIGKL